MHYLVLILTADNATLGIAERVERIHVHAGLLLAARSLHTSLSESTGNSTGFASVSTKIFF